MPVPLIFDGIEMVLEHDPAHRGRERQIRPVLVLLGARGGSFASIFSPAPSGLTGVDGGGSALAARGAAGLDLGDHRADRDRVADRDELLAHRAGDRRVDLDRDLVGLEARDRLVRATASPGCFSHAPSVASVIDSPSVGTLTSVAI